MSNLDIVHEGYAAFGRGVISVRTASFFFRATMRIASSGSGRCNFSNVQGGVDHPLLDLPWRCRNDRQP